MATSRLMTGEWNVLPGGGPAALPLSQPTVVTRDRRTVEVRQAYALPDGDAPLDYQLDVFLFLPRSLGVNAATYPREEFYGDASVYLRLDAPGRSLDELGDLKDPRCPLSHVHAVLARVAEPQAPPTAPLVPMVKLHAQELAEAIIHACTALAADAERGEMASPADFLSRVRALVRGTERALVAVQQVRADAEAVGPLCSPEVGQSLAFADEYVSAVLDEQVALLSEGVGRSEALRDGKGTAVKARLVLAQFAKEQSGTRMESGYALPWDEPNEYFTYRLGLLKKSLQQALYLNTRELKGDHFLRDSAAMVAAGLAATWAFLSQVPAQFGQVDPRTQLWLLASAVGAYMLKDRIKEWTRVSLTRHLRLNDFNRAIFSDALARLGLEDLEGRAKEKVRFLRPEEVEPEVRGIRMLHRSVLGVGLDNEDVLHYRRRLTLRAADGARLPAGFGVREILRVNVRHFTARMDDPLDQVSYYDGKTGAFTREQLPKTYHANLVLRVSARHVPARWLSRWRLVLTQDGLKRVESVSTRRVDGVLRTD